MELFPTRDLRFLLEEVLGIQSLFEHACYEQHDLDTVRDTLQLAHDIAMEQFLPIAGLCDEQEPELVDGRVVLPEALSTAVGAFVEAGFIGAGFDEDVGGMQLPYVVTQAVLATFAAATVAPTSYPGLTMAAASLVAAHGSEALKEQWLPGMLEGRIFGTMALSEPQAGSSLADLLTVAREAEDGTYRLVGNKMWITAADHDLSENILHLVLARIEGAPAGTRGISLFAVPKRLPSGEANDVRVVGVNHKMGYRAAVNTVFALGDEGGAVGWLVGEPHQGLGYMFHMMNEARIAVGLGAASLAWAGYRHSLSYARERDQGRPLTRRDPTTPQVPIVQHADVRRMLLSQKALAEGALMLSLYAANLVDEARIAREAGDETTAGETEGLLDLLTPVVKAWCSHYGLRANEDAIQVLGGYGYTREYPVERIYRDNRLNPIHEGTNGIQAIDLLGRKVPRGTGAPVLLSRIAETLAAASGEGEALAELAAGVQQSVERVTGVTTALMQLGATGQAEAMLANATPYLHLLGHTVVAWLWVEQARAAARAPEDDFTRGKLAAARYFVRWELPRTARWASLLEPVDRTVLDTDPAWL
ncbi:MAG: acyl-CoA dehydrogenase [Myxococcales bacterium]|nr:acyl-CoA dehydrogenase [Myxococcales bacterium]